MLEGGLQNAFGRITNWGRWSEKVDAKLPPVDDSAGVNSKGRLYMVKLDVIETAFNSSFGYKDYVKLFICASFGV